MKCELAGSNYRIVLFAYPLSPQKMRNVKKIKK